MDANHASVDELAQLEGIDQATAQALIEQRRAAPGGRFQDLSAVLDAAGLDASSTVPLTVLAHGPVQAPGQIEAQPWSEDARQALAGLLDERSIEVLEGLGEGDAESFAARVAAASPAPEVWGAILRHAAPAEGFQAGRIDVASASAEVLATLDGIDPDKAMHLVAVRDTLSDDSLSLMSWLWTEGGLDRSLEATVLSRITVGSFTWRCMLGIGEVREDDDHDMLQSADWYEVVFDVSEQTPRIALLREHLAAPGALTGLVFPTLSEADEEDEHEDDEDDSSVRTPDDALSDTATEPQVPALIRVDPPEPAMPIAIDIGNSPEPSQPPSTRAVNDPRLGRWR